MWLKLGKLLIKQSGLCRNFRIQVSNLALNWARTPNPTTEVELPSPIVSLSLGWHTLFLGKMASLICPLLQFQDEVFMGLIDLRNNEFVGIPPWPFSKISWSKCHKEKPLT